MTRTKEYKIRTNAGISTVQGYPIEIEGMNFFVHKDRFSWSISDVKSGLNCFTEDTKKAVIKKMTDFLSNDKNKKFTFECINNSISVSEYESNMNKFDTLRGELEQVLRFAVPICIWTKNIDTIRLDKMLNVPDGISTSDFIKNKYGQRAVDIINEMLAIKTF